jgi:hypothetical protein
MMDLLALLLVTAENGDVASAAFCRRHDGLVIVFAKNRPCTEDELKYIQLLVCHIMTLAQPAAIGKATSESIRTAMSMLLGTIFTNCKKKIRSTHNDMVKASVSLRTAVNELPLVLGQTLWSKVSRRFPELSLQWKRADDNSSAQAFVLFWISRLNEQLTKESWKFLVQAAWLMSSTEGFVQQESLQVYINHRTVGEALRRYADYYDAIQTLVSNAKKHDVSYRSLFLMEAKVEPARKKKDDKGDNALNLFNRFYQQREPDTQEFSADEVIQAFPDLLQTALVARQSSRQEVGVHAECAVALFLLKFGLLEDDRLVWKVGISKPMCWMCRRYLRWLAKTTGTTNHFSSYHGKIYPGWACPMDVFPNFLNDLQVYSLSTSKFWTLEPSNEIPNGMRLPDQLASNMLHEVQEKVAWIGDKVSGRKRKEDCALDSEPEDNWPLDKAEGSIIATAEEQEAAFGRSLLERLNQTLAA